MQPIYASAEIKISEIIITNEKRNERKEVDSEQLQLAGKKLRDFASCEHFITVMRKFA